MDPTPIIPITLQVNGESRLFPVRTLTQLIDHMALSGKRIAVEKNGSIVPRSQYAETPLKNGDHVEIVVAVGGG